MADAGRRGRGARLLGRAGLNLVDQVLSALTNVVLSVLVARAVDATGFGAFAVAFLVFSLLVGFGRAIIGQPLNIRFTATEGAERRRSVSGALVTAVSLGVAAGALTGVVGVLLDGVLSSTLLALAVVLPGLLVQDTCRMVFFAHRRPHLAVVNDATWAVTQFTAMGLLTAAGEDRPWPYVLAWGGAATLAAALGLLQLRVPPLLRDLRWWVRGQIGMSGYLFLEFLMGTGSSQGSILLVGGVGSVRDVGSIRAAQTLLGPLGIIGTAMGTFALPELSRRADLPARTRLRVAAAISGVMVVVTVCLVGVLFLIPDSLGVQLLGDTWTGAESVLLPMSVASLASGACGGPALVIYAMGQVQRTFRLHALQAPAVVAAMVLGVHLGGTVGAAWGLAVALSLMVPLWVLQLWVLVGTDDPSAPVRARRRPSLPAA